MNISASLKLTASKSVIGIDIEKWTPSQADKSSINVLFARYILKLVEFNYCKYGMRKSHL